MIEAVLSECLRIHTAPEVEQSIHYESRIMEINKKTRNAIKDQHPVMLWLLPFVNITQAKKVLS